MNIEKIITSNSFIQKTTDGQIVELVRIGINMFEFGDFKLSNELYLSFGKNLFEFFRANSYIIQTDDADYDLPKIRLLDENGFKVYYSKILYTKNLDEHEFLYKDIFQYRLLEETGLEAFLEVYKRVLTDDPEGRIDYRTHFNDILGYAGTDYNPKKWFLVWLKDKPIGVILPQKFETEESLAGIFHIGLVPEERGKGYGKILFSKCLQLLKDDGIKKYLGSTNVNNTPMRKVFEANGCKEWFKRFFYKAG